jgi:hypothetical protein
MTTRRLAADVVGNITAAGGRAFGGPLSARRLPLVTRVRHVMRAKPDSAEV